MKKQREQNSWERFCHLNKHKKEMMILGKLQNQLTMARKNIKHDDHKTKKRLLKYIGKMTEYVTIVINTITNSEHLEKEYITIIRRLGEVIPPNSNCFKFLQKKKTQELRSILYLAKYTRVTMGNDESLYWFLRTYIAMWIEVKTPKDHILNESIPYFLEDTTILLIEQFKEDIVNTGYDHFKRKELFVLHEFIILFTTIGKKLEFENNIFQTSLDFDITKNKKELKKPIMSMVKTVKTCFEGVNELLELLEVIGIEWKRKACRYLLVFLSTLFWACSIFKGGQETLYRNITNKKELLSNIIIHFGKDADCWLLLMKDFLSEEARLFLGYRLLPMPPPMVLRTSLIEIDRSQIINYSYRIIMMADIELLLNAIEIRFIGEDDSGMGLTRDWWITLFDNIFDEQTGAFLPCLDDKRRFFPNPGGTALTATKKQEKFYQFVGRLIALALINHVQVGVSLDQVLYKLLGGKEVKWQDTLQQDPDIFNSIQILLQLEGSRVRELGLYFSHRINDKDVDLCTNGSNILVNASNRELYIELLTQKRFVEPIEWIVEELGKGFSTIAGDEQVTKLFFYSLDLHEFDLMLHLFHVISFLESLLCGLLVFLRHYNPLASTLAWQ